jgi:PAS domain-containing protein
MTKKLTFALATVLLLNLTATAQTYELDQVRQVPSIDESNMKIIAFSVQKLFDEVIKEPEKYSSIKAVSETVYGFYDTDGDGRLDKVNPRNGKQYSSSDSEELKKNNRFLFNLIFDDKGNLVVPEKIYVISNREEEKDRRILTVGLIAFELPISESVRAELLKVRLQNIAKADVNSLTGGLNPVTIKIPFNLKYGASKSTETTGKALKSGDNIKISISRYFKGVEEENKFISMLKEQTDILEYKKGEFDFIIEASSFGYHIDINIMRDMVWSSQPKSFSVVTEKVKSFTGQGKKIKK